MPSSATTVVVMLFEDEVREAVRRLATLRTLLTKVDATGLHAVTVDEIANALRDAMQVCTAAFAGAERDDAYLVLVRKADLGMPRNVPAAGQPATPIDYTACLRDDEAGMAMDSKKWFSYTEVAKQDKNGPWYGGRVWFVEDRPGFIRPPHTDSSTSWIPNPRYNGN